jgi:hypothetical protein
VAIIRRSSFSYPRQWSPTQVPSWPVEIDWSHALAQNLVSCVLPGVSSADLTRNAPLMAIASGMSIVATPQGPGLECVSGNTGLTGVTGSSGIEKYIIGSPGSTLFWSGVILGGASGGNYPLIGVWSNTLTAPYVDVELANSGSSQVNLQWNSNDGYNSGFSGGTFTTNSVSTACGSFNYTGAVNAYLNGSNVGTGTFGGVGPQALPSSSGYLVIGGLPPAGGYTNSITNLSLVYNVALPAQTVAWLNAEPFAMLRPVVRRQYFAGSSSGGTTVNPSSGSIVLTGHAPTIAAGTTLHPVAGAVTLSGHVPTIAAAGNTTLNPAAGSVAITGHVPTIAAGLKLTPAAGSIVFTGHVPTVTPGTAAITLNPMFGSIVFQGQVPQIYAGVPFKGGGSGDGDKARQRWLDWLDKKARSRFEAKKASASVGKVAPSVPKVVLPEVAPASLSGEMTAVAPPFYAAEIRVDLLEAAIDAEVSAALSEDDDMAIILMLAHD